jgi:hypothetical protein
MEKDTESERVQSFITFQCRMGYKLKKGNGEREREREIRIGLIKSFKMSLWNGTEKCVSCG